ncbi:FAD-dependent monooxygenase [Microbispora catharanthi]|uniref:FAD-dependent oxidoreductase n=1 Tax=Microbispora catharanthi TaxID=1712871 RepID=A0A5N6BHI2_9ACTN|nr:FAD-dependent monooxygenase [Microbispora catharanthi]KAB8180026.1 FAD-dependent oxidoreductase [Microbispora catharanthi]
MNSDVIVVGAGPTGLLLAGDLAGAGVRVTLVERRTGESPLSRAFAVHARTLEMLDMRGLADQALASGTTVPGLLIWDHVTIGMTELPGDHPYMLVTPQYEIERLLLKRAVANGAELLSGHEVMGVGQDTDGVDVRVRPLGGEARTLRASYAVGADGRHSTVREAAGIPFPGHAVARSVMLADVRLNDKPGELLSVNGVREGFVFIAPFGDGWYRVIGRNHRNGDLPDDVPVDFEELKWLTRKCYGTDFDMHDPRWMSRFHSEERQAARYRAGRIFVVGDAAHVHAPAGGQGMNTGLQDAANLGWKLAAAVRGWAQPGLLDSYDEERRPVGRAVLRTSGLLTRLALLRSPVLRAVRNQVSGTAMRVAPLRRAAALTMLSGLGIRYPAPAGAHSWVGRRVPDLPLADSSGGGTAPARLYEALRGGRFVLVGRLAPPAGWGDRVDHVVPAEAGAAAMLVRPDGYLAWAGVRPGTADLVRALTGWCGRAA